MINGIQGFWLRERGCLVGMPAYKTANFTAFFHIGN